MQPVIIEDAISVAANTVNENVIVSNASLRQYLRAPFNSQALFMAVISATGLRVEVSHAAQKVIAESDLRVGTDLQAPNDILNDQFFPAAGDQLVVRANNTTGGALTLRYRLVLTPVEFAGGQRPMPKLVMQRGPIAIANGSVDTQLLDGLDFERAPWDCEMDVYMTASAAGITRKINVDTVSIAPPSAVAPLNRVPTRPFDMSVGDVEVPADKLVQLPVSNASGGSLNVFWRTEMSPA